MIRVNVGASEVRIRVVGVVVKISGVEVGVSGFKIRNFRARISESMSEHP